MKKTKLLFLFLLSLLLNGGLISYYFCYLKKDAKPYFHPFKVNLNITDESLYDAGYSSVPEDVPILGKTINDTSICFQLVYDCVEEVPSFFEPPLLSENGEIIERPRSCTFLYPLAKFCKIRIDKIDSVEIVNLVEHYGGQIVSEWNLNMDYPTFEIRYENHLQFRGSISTSIPVRKKSKPIHTLHFGCTYPLSEAQLKRFKNTFE